MKIVINNKNNYDKYFIYDYLPKYILNSVSELYDASRASQMNRELHLNILSIFIYAINNLTIQETGEAWALSINKNTRYKNYNLSSLIDYITYGTRTCKGYRLLYNIFKSINENIDLIYKRWIDGY